jgi:hypothetical protein
MKYIIDLNFYKIFNDKTITYDNINTTNKFYNEAMVILMSKY